MNMFDFMKEKKYNRYDMLINIIYTSIVSSITAYFANIYIGNMQKKEEGGITWV